MYCSCGDVSMGEDSDSYKYLSELRDFSLPQPVCCAHQLVRMKTLLSSFGPGS